MVAELQLPSMHDASEGRAAWGTVWLNGQTYPIIGRVATTDLGVFPPKTTIGDHTKNSNDILSVFTLSDLTGGGQIETMNEGTDVNRFWDGTFEFRFPGMNGNAPQVTQTRPDGVSPASVCRPLGDIGGRFYAAWNGVPYAWNNTTRTWFAANPTLANLPVNKTTGYDGWVYVPLGVNGYQRLQEASDGVLAAYDTGTVDAGLLLAKDFDVYADRLVALETTGQIVISLDGDTWERQKYTTNRLVRVDSTNVMRHLESFFNRNGDPCLHIVTDRRVLQYDPNTPRVWPTPLQFPPHPDVGLGAAVWPPGGDLWISTGLGMHRWSPQNTRQPLAGLNRQHGLPVALRGRVVDLCSEQSGLYALIQGNTEATALPSWLEDGMDDDDPYFPEGTAYSALYVWSGEGWGRIWMSEDPTTQATWTVVSAVDGYNLWWGVDSYAYTLRLEREGLNPMQNQELQLGYFQLYSWFETGWFDAAMEGFTKQAVRGVINAAHASAGDTITVSYKTSPTDEWTVLGISNSVGDTYIGFGYDEVGFPEGVFFEKIKFKFEFNASSERSAPFMDSFSLQYRKMPQDMRAYQFTVAIPSEEWEDGRSGHDIDHELRELKKAPLFRGVFGDMSHHNPLQLAIAGITGDNTPGTDHNGTRVVNVVDLTDERDYEYWVENVYEEPA